jgi:hypothetical protein
LQFYHSTFSHHGAAVPTRRVAPAAPAKTLPVPLAQVPPQQPLRSQELCQRHIHNLYRRQCRCPARLLSPGALAQVCHPKHVKAGTVSLARNIPHACVHASTCARQHLRTPALAHASTHQHLQMQAPAHGSTDARQPACAHTLARSPGRVLALALTFAVKLVLCAHA